MGLCAVVIDLFSHKNLYLCMILVFQIENIIGIIGRPLCNGRILQLLMATAARLQFRGDLGEVVTGMHGKTRARLPIKCPL